MAPAVMTLAACEGRLGDKVAFVRATRPDMITRGSPLCKQGMQNYRLSSLAFSGRSVPARALEIADSASVLNCAV